jgi:tetratricopeptide (TPR) repeat protein
VREADYDTWDRLIVKAKKATLPADQLITARGRGDTAAVRKHLASIPSDPRSITYTTRHLWVYFEDDSLAEAAGKAGANIGPPPLRPLTALALVDLDIARGRWASARQKLRDVATLNPFYAQMQRFTTATLPFLEMPPSEWLAIRDEIASWDATAPARIDVTVRSMMPHAQLYLLGLLEARLGNEQKALEHARAIEALPDVVGQPAVARDLAATIRAQVAYQQRRYPEVVSLLQPVRGEIPLPLLRRKEVVPTDYIFSQDHARYLRGCALVELGKAEEALKWLSTSFIGVAGEMNYRAPLHHELGRAYELLGDRTRAREHYGRFVRAWHDADPSNQGKVRHARNRLAALQ